jgi:hypothetical protein
MSRVHGLRIARRGGQAPSRASYIAKAERRRPAATLKRRPDWRRPMAAHWLADHARAWRRYVIDALRVAVIGFVMAIMVVFILVALLIQRIARGARRLLHSS